MQAWHARWPIRPILGFWRSKVPQNVRFPAQDADEPLSTVQNLTPLALSLAEKSSTVQNHIHTQITKKKQTNSKCYIHTLPIGMCGQKRGVV